MTPSYNPFSVIAFGKLRGLQLFHQAGFKGIDHYKLIEHLQLDLDEMPLRKGEIVFSKVLVNVRGMTHTFFMKYHFALDAYGRKGFRAVGIGLKGKKIKNWEDAIRLASILKALPLYEFSIVDFYLKQLAALPTERISESRIIDHLVSPQNLVGIFTNYFGQRRHLTFTCNSVLQVV